MKINISEQFFLNQKDTHHMERLLMRKRILLLGLLLLSLTLLAVACSVSDSSSSDGSSDTTGDVTIDGSSTVLPISEAVAEEFQLVAPDVNVSVGVSGTGGGFKKLCAGETDISDASRQIKDSEREACA
jgi:phosphate transport system substrate-binding protein